MDNDLGGFAEWAPLLLALAVPCAGFTIFGDGAVGRLIASVSTLVASGRYAYWRVEWSMPQHQSTVAWIWAHVFEGFELVTILSTGILAVFMTRTLDRSAQVDSRLGSALLNAPVDVFIPTYNEDYEILERTIVGALAIQHSDLRVWLLDDGNRPWARNLALELGARYVFRIKGKHAKAGNVNNGLREALSVGRPPEFILLLDADFVANRAILQRTLPLFEESDVGIVQTPQHFFNADPLQTGMLATQTWPDEQRFFFNKLLPCKDAWGAAFCCGTSAVFRVRAMEDTGGLATETVTEDMLTTFKMQEYGWRTIFLNERLSLGLAPEGLAQYTGQRARWCLGAMQQVYTRWSFAGVGRISLINRISSFDGFCYWAFVFPYKLMLFSAPMIYWWTGMSVVNASLTDMLIWLLPYAAVSAVCTVVLSGRCNMPVLTDVSQLLMAFTITRTVVQGLIKPFGHPFKVTAKGVSMEKMTIQWALLLPLLAMAVLTLGGMVLNLSPYSVLNGTAAFSVNVFWSTFNALVLFLSAMLCVELPQRRHFVRFETEEPVWVVADGTVVECVLRDISVGGARIHREGGWTKLPQHGEMHLMRRRIEPLELPFEAIRIIKGDLAVHFLTDAALRRGLIERVFTGDYDNDISEVNLRAVLHSVMRRAFA